LPEASGDLIQSTKGFPRVEGLIIHFAIKKKMSVDDQHTMANFLSGNGWMKVLKTRAAWLIAVCFSVLGSKAQFVIQPDSNALNLASRIVGTCNTVLSASLNTGVGSTGTFTYSGTNVGISKGVILTTGSVSDVANPQTFFCSVANGNNYADPDLTSIVSNARFDVSTLEFVFQVTDPAARSITFNSVFGSEEYPQYVGSTYNDIVKIFISGPKPCGGNYVKQNICNVTINTYNAGSNASQFVANYSLNYPDIAWGGYTTKISNTFDVVPCQTYTVKIAVADAGDGILDSGVLIEDAVPVCPPISITSTSVQDTCGKGHGYATITKPNDDCHHVYAINWPYAGTVSAPVVNTAGPLGNNTSTISGLSAGTYSAQVQLTLVPCGLVYTYPVVITVGNTGQAPVADFSFVPACANAPVQFTDQSVGISSSDPINTWKWDFDNNSVVDAYQQHPSHTYTAPATYSVSLFISSVSGCRSSVTKLITLNPNPMPVFSVADMCRETPMTAVNASTIAPTASIVSQSWNFGAGASPPLSNAVAPIVTYHTAGVKTITLSLQSSQGCTATATATVEVFELPVAGFSVSSVCQGIATAFTDLSSATPDAISAWHWDYQNDHVIDASAASPSFTYPSSGTFTAVLVVESTRGCRDTVSHAVEVWGHALPDFSSGAVCFGTATTFSNATNANLPANTGGVASYGWTFAGGSTSNAVNPTYTYTASGNNNAAYSTLLVVTTVHNCVDSIRKPAMVYAIPTASFTADSVCQGAVSHLVDASNGRGNLLAAFDWDFLSDGTVDISGVSAANYAFPNFGNNAVSYTVSTFPVAGLTCSGIQTSIPVWVNPLPIPDFTSVNTCINEQPNTFDAGATAIPVGTVTAFQWAFGDGMVGSGSSTAHAYTSPGVYTVTLTATSNRGCQKKISHPSEVYAVPQVTVSNSQACFGKAMSFEASALPGSGVVASWQWDLEQASGGFERSGNPVSYVFASPGSHSVALVVQSDRGCKDTVRFPVYVDYVPVPDFVVDIPAGCAEHCVVLQDQTPPVPGPGQNVTLRWQFGDGAGSNGLSGTSQAHCYQNKLGSTPVQYSVKLLVTTDRGCIDSMIRQNYITVYPLPLASYDLTEDPGTVSEPLVQFQNQSANYSTFWWDFGDGSSRDSVNIHPAHLYGADYSRNYGTFLIVENQYHCRDTAYRPVEIKPAFTFYIPNAFSPVNADRINDTFVGAGIGILNYEMWIFDRWGELLYYTDDITKGWDGKNHLRGGGNSCKPDVYVWKVKLKDVFSKQHDYVGHVTLLQ